jgi:hypothetical protein
MEPPTGWSHTLLVTGTPIGPAPKELIVPVPLMMTSLVSTESLGGASGVVDATGSVTGCASPTAH